MYAKCGSMVEARQVFDSMKHPNVGSWTALILGYADNGQGHAALDMFTRMRSEGPSPNSITFVAALRACTSLASKGAWRECRDQGKEVHCLVGCHLNIYVQNTLIDMYANCGSMTDAHQVFDGIKLPDSVSWNALILGYADNGQGFVALDLFARMNSVGPALTSVTFVAAVKACISLVLKEARGCREWGKEIHVLAIQNGYDSHMYVQNALIDMYGKCRSMVDARQVFDSMKFPSVVSWTTLIQGYAENGQGFAALDLFTRMRSGGPAPNSVTFVAALKACSSLLKEGTLGWPECRDRCEELQNLAGCHSNSYVQNILIDIYATCGSMVHARQVFDSMKNTNVVSWNALILGYAENGQGLVALEIFKKMDIEPDCVTFIAALKACGLIGELEFGRTIHLGIKDFDVALVTCLVDFYSKCGTMMEAQDVFDVHSETRVSATWNALLTGYSSCGDHQHVFQLYKGMQDAGFQPDSVTLLCILMCCSHAGLVKRGKESFDAMSTRHGIIPNIEHYTCMLDMFGRSNQLDDAMALSHRIPCAPDDVSWTIILGACKKWKNVQIGRLAFQSLIYFNNKDASAYVFMEQIYGSRGMLQEQELVMEMRKKLRNLER